MLIIRNQAKTKFVSKTNPIQAYIIDVKRNTKTGKLEFVYRLDVSLKTLKTVKSGITKIRITINSDAVRKPTTNFETLITYGVIPYQQKVKIQQLKIKGLQTMEFINQAQARSNKHDAAVINVPISVTLTKENYANECLLSFAGEIASQFVPTHQGSQEKLISNEKKYPTLFRGKEADEVEYAFVTMVHLDDIIRDFSKLRNLRIDPSEVFDMKNGKITGQNVSNSIKYSENEEQINTISGAMTARTSALDNYFEFGNEVLLNQIADVYKNINQIGRTAPYSKICLGMIKNGVPPTDVVAGNVDDIITAEMIYNGTGIAT